MEFVENIKTGLFFDLNRKNLKIFVKYIKYYQIKTQFPKKILNLFKFYVKSNNDLLAYTHTQNILGLGVIPTSEIHTQNPKNLGMKPKPNFFFIFWIL